MNIITNNRPPTYGTTSQTWEGFIRADELLPGDHMLPEGRIDNVVRHGDDEQEIIMAAGYSDFYANDDMLYIERTVKVTVSEA